MEDWKDRLAHLRVGIHAGQRRVHKPLLVLMLLGRAQRGEPSRVEFGEVDAKVREGLLRFGPPVRTVSPELPFWHLRSDGIWRVEGEEHLMRRAGHDRPRRSALVRENPVGYVPDEWWRVLQADRELIPALASQLLYDFWPHGLHEEILAWCGLDLVDSVDPKRRRRDPEFRRIVLRAYECQCAVCGFDGRIGEEVLLDAAHVKWHCEGGPDTVDNGLTLCALHHVAFDRGALGIDERRCLRVSQDLLGHSQGSLRLIGLAGQPLRVPQDRKLVVSERFIQWHGRYVFRPPGRTGGAA